MREINYQELRERYSQQPVPKCRICGDEMTVQRICGRHITYGCTGATYDDKGCYYAEGRSIADDHYGLSRVTVIDVSDPEVLALLDERERNQQYIKSRDQENEDIALTVGKLRVELEAAKSKLNEQREYYEGVIADGSKRIAELEKSEEQLINERDHAESALADMYFAATGDRPEWSNCFSFSDAVDAVVDRIADLEAKQPSPIVPEGLVKAVRFYEQVKRENPPAETGAWKDAVDWVLKEACQVVNTGIKGE
ncbi:TPA: ead/Ea22-like family protein [Escherichia coli]|nr:ead/Ea22-like family protein [Escherichia coli]